MSSAPPPRISRAPAFPLIWAVPVVAVAICAWIGVRALYDRGPEITIDFTDGSGVEAGTTVLEYKGVAAGTVESVQLTPALTGVTVRVRLTRRAAALADGGGRFWIVHPEIGFSGVRGLDTLVTGVRLNVLPGQGPPTQHFIGLDQPPIPDDADSGRSFILHSDTLGSLTAGAPVFYREFKVGRVESTRLAPNATAVLVRIHIDAPYVDLVRVDSKFWNTGGFSFKVSLFGGAQLKDTSLESLFTGGVAFATPDTPGLAAVAPAETQFEIASAADKAWLKWAPVIPIQAPESASPSVPKRGMLNELLKP